MASPIIPALTAIIAAILFAGILTITNAQTQDSASRLEMIANETAFQYESVIDAESLGAPSGLAVSHIWSDVTIVPDGSTETITALCDSSSYPTGGGFVLGSSDLEVISSHAFANQSSRGWTATITNTNASVSFPAMVDVICLSE